MSSRSALAASCLSLALLAACGAAEEPADPTAATTSVTDGSPSDASSRSATDRPTATPTPSPRPAMGTKITIRSSEFGPMLFDAAGQAIYLFDVETTTEPRCYDDCATAWPPVLTKGEPAAGRGVEGSLLGTTKRTDGTVQVTYGGHPLYYYAHEAPREVKCHDVFLNGGNWYVVQPDGTAAPPG